jgi:hypothetical protein
MSVVPVSLPAAVDGLFTSNDDALSTLLSAAKQIAGADWTVIYTSKITNRVLTKRQLPSNYTGPWPNTAWEDRPLFQKYWFLNNGVFMGVFCMIPVLLIIVGTGRARWNGIC